MGRAVWFCSGEPVRQAARNDGQKLNTLDLTEKTLTVVTHRIGNRAGWRCDRLVAAARSGPHGSKGSVMSVYRVTEIIGTSSTSWEDAAAEAIRTAAGTLRDLRVAEVVKQDIHLDEGGAITYRTKLQLSFKYEPGH